MKGDIKGFLEEAVRSGAYSTEQRLRFRMEHIFKDVDLNGKRVLDVGGGNGLHSFYSVAMGASRALCLEPEETGSTTGVLDKFENLKASLPNGDRVELDTRTIQEYEGEEEFDIILLINSINHLDEENCRKLREDQGAMESYKKIFDKMYSLMAPGGRMVITDCSSNNFFGMLGIKNPFAPKIDWSVHQPPAVWANLLGESGFRKASTGWSSPNRVGKAGRFLFGNRFASFFMQSHFRLVMGKE
ncbi:MAG: DUF1698 domain-containing protein [Candidatus Thermoplasmatota archaeon]|nr:DUF1698 domain-containing protein [Candidatus Thermoplasmatota archaeon]